MARGAIISRELKDGTRKYDAVIRLDKKQVWKTFDRKKDAEYYLGKHSTATLDGSYQKLKKGTFGDFAKHWRTTHCIVEQLKPSTVVSYLSVLAKHILPEFERAALQAIRSVQIDAFRASLQKKGLSAKTVRNVLNLLGAILEQAVEDDYIHRNPMERIKKPEVSKDSAGRALRPVEITALLASAGDALTRLVIMVAILTGMRRAEIFGLRWQDVDFRKNIIRVRQALYWRYGSIRPAEGECFTFQEPKSKKSTRDIDLSPALKRELQVWYLASPKTGLVLQTEAGRPLDPNGFAKKKFAAAVKAAGLGHVRFHDMRHSFGSLKLDQNENLVYVSRQLGHASIDVTARIYAHQLREQRPEAAAKTDSVLFPVLAEQEAAESTAVN